MSCKMKKYIGKGLNIQKLEMHHPPKPWVPLPSRNFSEFHTSRIVIKGSRQNPEHIVINLTTPLFPLLPVGGAKLSKLRIMAWSF